MNAFVCGLRAFLILPTYYPADFARGFGPFVDLLLTRRGDSKKPRGEAGRKALFSFVETGCGGRIWPVPNSGCPGRASYTTYSWTDLVASAKAASKDQCDVCRSKASWDRKQVMDMEDLAPIMSDLPRISPLSASPPTHPAVADTSAHQARATDKVDAPLKGAVIARMLSDLAVLRDPAWARLGKPSWLTSKRKELGRNFVVLTVTLIATRFAPIRTESAVNNCFERCIRPIPFVLRTGMRFHVPLIATCSDRHGFRRLVTLHLAIGI
ncbi:hypothetical protein G5V65_16250 [Rhodobacter sp. HX-7-19]|uniref:Uncharacterized protein n=1 Tax=Paragemmobacter kunshanensis TaxID=2583234 RepID=A0A6M1TVJ0_9RHOB|nr:hypothetical protein [Rhodobacter kunshanensis]NGQ92448.1 hypothetical protein [Rhodobacter kunshanensis]